MTEPELNITGDDVLDIGGWKDKNGAPALYVRVTSRNPDLSWMPPKDYTSHIVGKSTLLDHFRKVYVFGHNFPISSIQLQELSSIQLQELSPDQGALDSLYQELSALSIEGAGDEEMSDASSSPRRKKRRYQMKMKASKSRMHRSRRIIKRFLRSRRRKRSRRVRRSRSRFGMMVPELRREGDTSVDSLLGLTSDFDDLSDIFQKLYLKTEISPLESQKPERLMSYQDISRVPLERIITDLGIESKPRIMAVFGDPKDKEAILTAARKGSTVTMDGTVELMTKAACLDEKTFSSRYPFNIVNFASSGDLSGDVHANIIVLFPEEGEIIWIEPNGIDMRDDEKNKKTNLSLDSLKLAVAETLLKTKRGRGKEAFEKIYYMGPKFSLNIDALPDLYEDAVEGNCLGWAWAIARAVRHATGGTADAYRDAVGDFLGRCDSLHCESRPEVRAVRWTRMRTVESFFKARPIPGDPDPTRSAWCNLGIQLMMRPKSKQKRMILGDFMRVLRAIDSRASEPSEEELVYLESLFGM